MENDTIDKVIADMKRHDPEIVGVTIDTFGNVFLNYFGSDKKGHWTGLPLPFRNEFRERLIKLGF